MKLILITSPKSSRGRYELGLTGVVLLVLALLAASLGVAYAGFRSLQAFEDVHLNRAVAQQWKQKMAEDKQMLLDMKAKTELELQAYQLSFAQAQTRLIRLEALGEKLLKSGKIDKNEFNFSKQPAVGGLEQDISGDSYEKPYFSSDLDAFLLRLEERETQMAVLDSLLKNELLEKEVFLAGRPIKQGWMSSFFGKRLDPFTGKLAYHKGVDFAGKENAEIIAVASGVVIWSGDRYGYGNIVEIDHGQGFKTRYAHNKKNLVKTGEIVRKGQTIALMGSTGRSTGPHTHFEVIRNGQAVNPEHYVYRDNR